jgi:uncharacterized protein (TIGR02271 family)
VDALKPVAADLRWNLRVEGEDRRARVLDDGRADPTHALVERDDGRRFLVPAADFAKAPDGTWSVALAASREVVASAATNDEPVRVIPVIEEQLRVDVRVVESGRVRLTRHVTERLEEVAPELTREEVRVERVPVNRYVDGPVPPRMEGGTWVLSVLEEVLVVEKRTLLREELRVTKVRVPAASEPQVVALRRESVEVERLPARVEGDEREPAADGAGDRRE